MNTSWDASIVPGATVNDIDREAIDYFLFYAIKEGRLNEVAQKDTTEKILHNLGLADERGQLTMAALLLFGKDIQRWCPTAIFRIGRFGASQADLITQDSISCPLVKMPGEVITTLRSKYLVSPIHYEGLQRVEPLEIPEDGLREMVCNAIVHKDYLSTFIQMRVWNDRVELWNGGSLPVGFTIETLLGQHESHPRNTLIAKVFYLAGFIESWGRGYEKIRKAFADEHLQMPVFEQVRGGVMATIQRERFMQHEAEKTQQKTQQKTSQTLQNQQKTQQETSQETQQKTQQKTQQIIVALIESNPKITIQEMADTIGINRSNIHRNLKKLKKHGIIRRVGPDKGGHWVVIA
jgi:ATP-dependent DNA helicase RecG